ncbi:MAG TPA: sigma 54-interacting transcriptional regulator, partial [Planctomycetota bacterium]|nr:sigma 54-interacting transcriptional regulator [Planctomycetota bacterium]
MIKSDEFLPNGFCGPVRTWSELLPPAERSLRLPRDLPQVAPGLHCQQPIEPSLQFDLIEVQAVTESMGRVEDAVRALALRLADGGTLVLDEIGEMKLALQGKLLHVLQDGEFNRLGSN